MAPNSHKCAIAVLAAAGTLLIPAYSQQSTGQTSSTSSGTSAGTSTSTGSTGTGRTTATVPSTTTPGVQTPMPEMQRPIYISGKVRLDDGTPPPETVVIERICGGAGAGRPEAYTDTKGRFSFEVGRNSSMFSDASVEGTGGFGRSSQNSMTSTTSGGVFDRQLMNCEIRAVLPGFRSDVVSLSNHHSLDSPEVGTIILHRLGKVDGRVISATSLNAPKDARKAYEKGQDQAKRAKLGDAEKSFRKAVDAYPKYAAAWYELGRVQEASKQDDEARKSYEQATSADPKYINPWLQLSEIAARKRNWEEVAATTDRALKLDPFDYPQTYFLNSVAYYNLGKYDLAEKSAREAAKLDSRHRYPQVNRLLGVLLAQRADYGGAAEHLRTYLKSAPKGADIATVETQLAEIEKRANAKKAAPAAAPTTPE